LEKNANAPRLIGGTKGSHIIVAPFPGAPLEAIYVEAQADRRPFFIIPWNSNYLIGTTDLRYDGDLDRIQIEQKEIDYLLRETNLLLPEAGLTSSDILYTYSGVRPLPFTDGKAERSITRRHFIQPHPRLGNLFSIVGGKLTTYRSLAEEAVDLVFEKLGRTSPACFTATEPLVEITPALVSPTGFSNTALSPKAMERLQKIYGGRGSKILKLAADDSSLGEVFDHETGALAAEVVYSVRDECAQTLADCLLRRTMVGLNSSLGVGADEAAAQIGQKHLGWSEERGHDEVRSYREFIQRFRV
jgi:glycerol-3-phosphate dehydrogenase